MIRHTLALFMLLGLSPVASALNYYQSYQLALLNDPIWLSAQQEQLADRQDHAISRANLLPNISYNYRWSENDSDGETTSQGTLIKQNRQYDSYYSALVLRQPLFDLAAVRQYQQAGLTAELAEVKLQQQKLQLSMRVLDAYLAVLQYWEQSHITSKHLEMLSQEQQRLASLFKYGEATRTDILDITSRYRLTQVEQMHHQNQHALALDQLSILIGRPALAEETLRLSSTHFETFLAHSTRDATELAQWQLLAQQRSLELLVSESMYQLAQLQVKRLQAERYPKLSAFAQRQISNSNTETTVGQRYDTGSYGIELSLPIFSGGATTASIRQANARLEQSKYDWQKTQNSVKNEVRRQYLELSSSQERVQAYQLALDNIQGQIIATRYSLQGGERTLSDVLNAEQQHYQTQQDLLQAKYDFLKAWLGIRLATGVLNDNDVQLLSDCFEGTAQQSSAALAQNPSYQRASSSDK
jgi:protease secretion system outer membrane protein